MEIINEIKLNLNFNDQDSSRIMFEKLFLNNDNKKDNDDDDDLIFLIYKITEEFRIRIDVFRRSNTNLPLMNPMIDWRDTIFLNLILQKLNYTIYLTVLTRTSVNHYHVLSKQKLTVFCSPSQHSVLYKEKMEQYSYPMINFHVDNYEDFLFENVVNYLEIVYIELLASVDSSQEPLMLSSFSINYQSIDDAFCEKKSIINGHCLGVAKVKDFEANAYGEIVIRKKIQRSISDNPSTKFNLTRFDCADSSLAWKIKSSLNSPIHNQQPCSQFTDDNDNCLIIDSQDLLLDLNNENCNQLWYQRGFSQLYFRWKNKQKDFKNSYHCMITQISLPCEKIIENLLSNNYRKSILII